VSAIDYGEMGDHGANCYICSEVIPAKATNWGFTWGSDGFYPDGASAMYCCWNCRAFWINPPDDDHPVPLSAKGGET
jgi:hypothetical protein